MTYQAPIDDMLCCMKELAGLDATARLQGLEEVMPETAQACAELQLGDKTPLPWPMAR
ncbi:acyl-CoA dehydrogenase N-terminal domain-containing protein [Comamonas thiooxydans]|nr:acyl-CoA dehydrogenase N-terminal domain-containing protein [Comamonas thiooxydans]